MEDFQRDVETIFAFRRRQKGDEPHYVRAGLHLELVYESLLSKFGLTKMGVWMDIDDWINDDESQQMSEEPGEEAPTPDLGEKSPYLSAGNGRSESAIDQVSSQLDPSRRTIKGVDRSSMNSMSSDSQDSSKSSRPKINRANSTAKKGSTSRKFD
jgi:hypothetical protein